MRSPVTLRTVLLVLVGAAGVVVLESGTRVAVAGPPDLPTTQPAEFRAVFVATAYNIDWPSKPGLHHVLQSEEIKAIVDRASELNLNVIILQVRAFGDRIHRHTKLTPPESWSAAVMRPIKGSKDPDADAKYDPLDEWITACHVKGIELHAWVNPLRVNSLVKVTDPANPTPTTLPAMPTDDGQRAYLDPTYESVHKYTLEVTRDLIGYQATAPNTEYAGIDGMLFDHDLPYPTLAGITANPCNKPPATAPSDRVAWMKTVSKQPANAPRSTLEVLIQEVCDQANARGVKFGLSPCQDDAITMGWLKAGRANYAIPELYFQNASKPWKPELDKWLDAIVPQPGFTPIVVAGLFTTRVHSPPHDSHARWPLSDIVAQISDARSPHSSNTKLSASGQAHYSAIALRATEPCIAPGSITEKLKENTLYGDEPRFVPPCMPTPAGTSDPRAPQNVKLTPHGTGQIASWEPATGSSDLLFWAVWLHDGTHWGKMQVIDKRSLGVGQEIKWVAVKAIDRYNRVSDFGTSP